MMADYTLDDALAEHLLAVAEHIPDLPLGAGEPTSTAGVPHVLAAGRVRQTGLCDDTAPSGTPVPLPPGRDEPPAVARVVGGERAAAGAGPARWDDPSTSFAAGQSISAEGIAASEAYVLGLLCEIEPATDDRLCAVAAQRGARWTAQRLRSARANLTRRHRIYELDRLGTTSTGRRAKRWTTTTPEGIAS